VSTNLSKLRRKELLDKIKAIHKYISTTKQDDNTHNLLSFLNDLEKEINGKKFGLVFEEHREAIDEILETHTPVLTENKKLFIDNGGQMNFLIEGDNLAALKLLLKTHKGKIDFIYIDPPYNTGNNDFKYDDDFVDKEDGFRHSKWLSFMGKRITLLKSLMSKRAYICMSIDNNEQTNLKALCDTIFGEENFIDCLPRRTKSSGKTTNKISSNHDYVLIYGTDSKKVAISGLDHSDTGFKYEDEFVEIRGKYKLNQTLDYDSLQYSQSLDYPLKIGKEIFYAGSSYEKYQERQKGNHKRADWAWRWSKDLFDFGYKNNFIVIKRKKDGTARIYTKTYLNASIGKTNKDYSIIITSRTKPLSSLEFTEASFSNDNAKKDLKKVLPDFTFDYSKPVSLIEKLMRLNPNQNITILDCFAGTGTTGQATFEVNQDGGGRKFILITNNENNICKEGAYQRIKNTIKNEKLIASLKYFKIDYVPITDKIYYEYADALLQHIRELVELENGINFIGNDKIAIVLTEEELTAFVKDIKKYKNCRKLYRGHNVLVSGVQQNVLKSHRIAVNVIPDYYYGELDI
jgi:adenine-specific DNA-methyltransferase